MTDKTKKALNIATTIATWLVVGFTVFIMIFTIISGMMFNESKKNETDKSIFGYKFFIVLTDSMSKSENNKDIDVHFNAGDIVIIENISFKEKCNLKSGQIISFTSLNEDETYNKPITHMIREPKYDENTGAFLGYITYGTNTGTNDEALVDPGLILGVYRGKLPNVGSFFAFIKTVPGYIICILTPFLLIILYNGANVIRLFRRYRKEQTAQIQAERAEIAAERKEAEDMMRELLALKAQLQQQQTMPQPTQVVEETQEETQEETNE